jgi:hypothetical protein
MPADPASEGERGSVFKKILRTLGTPLPMAVFFVTATTGLMMFFKIGQASVKELHEWLSLVFVLGAVLHIVRNFKAFRGYLRTKNFLVVAAMTAVAAAAMVVPAFLEKRPERGQNPLTKVAQEAAVGDIAPLLHTTPQGLVDKLKGRGLTVPSERASLTEVAKASGKEPREVLDITFGPGAGGPSRGPQG